ncbi:unnamed protein product [Angiostrongylus costaricensis]|uniref:RING-type domain-containing protein n=1 Tax=Angiostrongylus costaricensis TaxID=334426 RepID=A0A0R3PVU7_ANGCS|nr:unnamed protein product [Angiostrongylus costaricensis]
MILFPSSRDVQPYVSNWCRSSITTMNVLGRCGHFLCNNCHGLVYNDDGISERPCNTHGIDRCAPGSQAFHPSEVGKEVLHLPGWIAVVSRYIRTPPRVIINAFNHLQLCLMKLNTWLISQGMINADSSILLILYGDFIIRVPSHLQELRGAVISNAFSPPYTIIYRKILLVKHMRTTSVLSCLVNFW